MHRFAHENCFIANSVKTDVRVTKPWRGRLLHDGGRPCRALLAAPGGTAAARKPQTSISLTDRRQIGGSGFRQN